MNTAADLEQAVLQGAVKRVRPKMMTVTAIIAGLLPLLWGTGTGSTVMRRIAAPMIGGMVSSTVLTLVLIPVAFALLKEYLPFESGLWGAMTVDRKSTRLNSSHIPLSRMPSSA